MPSARRSGLNEQISTYGGVGLGRDYTALATWEGDTDYDLVTATTSETLECFDDEVFDDTISMLGATTSSSYLRTVRPALGRRYLGSPYSGVRFSSTAASAHVFQLFEKHTQIQDIAASLSGNVAAFLGCFVVMGTTAEGNNVVGCVALGASNANPGGSAYGFVEVSNSPLSAFVDCVAVRAKNNGFHSNKPSGSTLMYNCTALKCGGGFHKGGSTLVLKNCLGWRNTAYDFHATIGAFDAASTHNASSDLTAPGIVAHLEQAFDFVDEVTDDYRLALSDTGATAKGINLADDALYAFDDDMHGDFISTWSIGADAQSIYYSARRRGVNEQISTYGGVGLGRDYTALGTWEADTDIDLVAAGRSEVLECYDDEVFDDGAALEGATTDISYLRIIRPASGQGHDGTPNTGVRFARAASALLTLSEANSSVQDIVGSVNIDVGSQISVFAAAQAQANKAFVGCIAHSSTNALNRADGFVIKNSPTGAKFIDCMCIDIQNAGFYMENLPADSYFYNCTAVGCGEGFRETISLAGVLKNCLASGNTTDFNGTFDAASTNNASSDATAPGARKRINQTFTFVDAANDDYHLTATDEGARNHGAYLADDPAYRFNEDIDGERVDVWSIGADAKAPGVDWFTQNYERRLPLTVDKSQVSGGHHGWPVLVDITHPDLAGYAQADGDDILFTDQDFETQIAHQIESYDSVSGHLVAWVYLPFVNGAQGRTFYVYYGNTSISRRENAAGVWVNGFRAVWHLAEDPSGTAPQILDSSGNAHHGTTAGTMTSGDLVAGQIEDGVDFDGTDDYADCGNTGFLSKFTLSAWVKYAYPAVDGYNAILSRGATFDLNTNFAFSIRGVSAGEHRLALYFQDGAGIGGNEALLGGSVDGTWIYVAATLDASDTILDLYAAGARIERETLTKSPTDGGQNTRIGHPATLDGTDDPFPGVVDEARIAAGVREPGWIETEYNNQTAPVDFITVGVVQTPSIPTMRYMRPRLWR